MQRHHVLEASAIFSLKATRRQTASYQRLTFIINDISILKRSLQSF